MTPSEEEFKKKSQRVTELGNLIKFHGGQWLGPTKTAEIEELQARLEFRLHDLWEQSRIKEATIKIEIYEKVVEVIKRK